MSIEEKLVDWIKNDNGNIKRIPRIPNTYQLIYNIDERNVFKILCNINKEYKKIVLRTSLKIQTPQLNRMLRKPPTTLQYFQSSLVTYFRQKNLEYTIIIKKGQKSYIGIGKNIPLLNVKSFNEITFIKHIHDIKLAMDFAYKQIGEYFLE